MPLQPVSSERNHQVADKFRKVSCLNVYGGKRGRVGVKQCMHSLDCLLSVFFYDYMLKLFPIFYLANFVCFYPSKYKAFPPNINYIFSIYILYCFYLDEFKIGVWEDFSKIQDPSLVSLASSLPRVVLNAKARNTTVRYAYGWNRWKIWSKSKIGVAYLPAQPMFVALYLRQFLDSAKTTSTIDTAVYSIC